MPEGWIKIHRKLLDWEWSDNPDVFTLWVHCLLLANHETKKWHGVLIKNGSFITSLTSLSKITGLSIQNVRTSLDKLKSTHELTQSSTSKYTVISINKWSDYQPTNTLANKQLTNNQQTTNNNQECKNDKKGKSAPTKLTEESYVELYPLLTEEKIAKISTDHGIAYYKVRDAWEQMLRSRISTDNPAKNWIMALSTVIGLKIKEGKITRDI
jgi:hypothetical protein